MDRNNLRTPDWTTVVDGRLFKANQFTSIYLPEYKYNYGCLIQYSGTLWAIAYDKPLFKQLLEARIYIPRSHTDQGELKSVQIRITDVLIKALTSPNDKALLLGSIFPLDTYPEKCIFINTLTIIICFLSYSFESNYN